MIFAGGFVANCIWCVILHVRNGSARDYLDPSNTSLRLNYVLSASAGTIWYCQFMFYGMGTTKMSDYDFSSWTIHMAFIIVFSNLWGLLLWEWKGAGRRAYTLISAGLAVLLLSTVIVGMGNYLKTQEPEPETEPVVTMVDRTALP